MVIPDKLSSEMANIRAISERMPVTIGVAPRSATAFTKRRKNATFDVSIEATPVMSRIARSMLRSHDKRHELLCH